MSWPGWWEHWLGKGHPQDTVQGGGGWDVGSLVAVDPICSGVCVCEMGPREA